MRLFFYDIIWQHFADLGASGLHNQNTIQSLDAVLNR